MRKTVLLGAIALCTSLAPAFAGEVYVPFVVNKTVNGATYRTRIWVSNTSTATQKASIRFIAENTDGTYGAVGLPPVPEARSSRSRPRSTRRCWPT